MTDDSSRPAVPRAPRGTYSGHTEQVGVSLEEARDRNRRPARNFKAPVTSGGAARAWRIFRIPFVLLALLVAVWIVWSISTLLFFVLLVMTIFAGLMVVLRLRQPKRLVLEHEPTQGFQGIFWQVLTKRLYFRFGWSWLVWISLPERRQNALNGLWALRAVRKVFVFKNLGGGAGKTSGATWYAAGAGESYVGQVSAVDVNENVGFVGKRFKIGAKKESYGRSLAVASDAPDDSQWLNGVGTLRLREFIQRRHELGSEHGYQVMLAEVDRHRWTGVFVIASNENEREVIRQEELQKAIEALPTQIVVCDCGNGLDASTNLGATAAADVVAYVGTPKKPETLDSLAMTMEYDFGLFPEKVENCFVVIFGDSPRKRKRYARRYGVSPERVFIFPENRYMANTKSVLQVNRLPLRLQVVLFESLLAMMRADVRIPAETDVSRAPAELGGEQEVSAEMR